MPITDHYQRLPLATIWVHRDDRQRTKIDTSKLVDSVRKNGVLHPVIVQRVVEQDGPGVGRHRLIVGERRYTCSVELGLPDIPVRFAEDLSDIERQIIELEENIKRQDLDWPDIVRGTERIHRLYQALDPEWTQEETAEACALQPGTLSIYLTVARHITEERIIGAGTVREAYNILSRRDARAAGDALAEILETPDLAPGPVAVTQPDPLNPTEPPPRLLPGNGNGALPPRLVLDPAKTILQESFLHWAPSYSGRKFNFIHCDFPFGIKVFAGPQAGAGRHQAYDDGQDVYFRLLECLLTNLDRLMSVSGHMMFWYSEQYRDETREMFRRLAPSLAVHKHPLVWVKSDNAGIASDVRQGPRHVYETCLFITRGQRQIVRVVGDAYSAPTDHKFHVSTKPEPMLRHFMTMIVDEQTSVLDPTCGSASSIRAAESLGARSALAMDIDEQTVGMARMALRQARALRGVVGATAQ
jgi:ParB/RepB/Spo0J family partition protein